MLFVLLGVIVASIILFFIQVAKTITAKQEVISAQREIIALRNSKSYSDGKMDRLTKELDLMTIAKNVAIKAIEKAGFEFQEIPSRKINFKLIKIKKSKKK